MVQIDIVDAMWFITTNHKQRLFYSPNKTTKEVNSIEWTFRKIVKDSKDPSVEIELSSSEPMISDTKQALCALSDSGIKGFNTKNEAKTFAKSLGVGPGDTSILSERTPTGRICFGSKF